MHAGLPVSPAWQAQVAHFSLGELFWPMSLSFTSAEGVIYCLIHFLFIKVHWTLKKIYLYFLHAFLWVWEDLKISAQPSVICSQSSPWHLLWFWGPVGSVGQAAAQPCAGSVASQEDLHPFLTESGNHGIPGLERNLRDHRVQQPPCLSSVCVCLSWYLALEVSGRECFCSEIWSTHWTQELLQWSRC